MTILIRPTLRSVFVIPIAHIDSIGIDGNSGKIIITTIGGSEWMLDPLHDGHFDELAEKLEDYHKEAEADHD